MANYTPTGSPQTLNKGSSAVLRNEFALIASGMNAIPDGVKLQAANWNYSADTGSANTYVVTLPSPYLTAYVDGMEVVMKAGSNNTGACTINVNGFGTRNIRRIDGTELQAGDILFGSFYQMRYNGTEFRIDAISSVAQYATAAANSASSAASSASSASTSAGTATTQAGIATTQAGISTTKAGESSASASTATTQAGIATTQAGNASSSASLSQDWAVKLAGPVSGGEYSSKYWAQYAASIVATIPSGTINDSGTSLTSVWSSTKVSNELALKGTLASANTWALKQVFGAAVQETRIAMGANNIDLSLGNYFTKTFSAGAVSLTVSNVPAAGTVACFILDATNAGTATITWMSGARWAGGTAPTLTSAGRDVIGGFTHDGGTTWTLVLISKDAK